VHKNYEPGPNFFVINILTSNPRGSRFCKAFLQNPRQSRLSMGWGGGVPHSTQDFPKMNPPKLPKRSLAETIF
jgi:hypothetical protein